MGSNETGKVRLSRPVLAVGLSIIAAGVAIATLGPRGDLNAIGYSPTGILGVLLFGLGGLVIATSWNLPAHNRAGLLTTLVIALIAAVAALWLAFPDDVPSLAGLPMGSFLEAVIVVGGFFLIILLAVFVGVAPLYLIGWWLVGWWRGKPPSDLVSLPLGLRTPGQLMEHWRVRRKDSADR